MINNFLIIWKAIKVIITISKSKAFKNKALILTDTKIEYIENYYSIISIFVKVTIKLQSESYPTIYYLIPEVYNIYIKLKKLKTNLFLN